MNVTSRPVLHALVALVAGAALGLAACGGSDRTASQERAAIEQRAPAAPSRSATATATTATTTPAARAPTHGPKAKATSKAKRSSTTSRKVKRGRTTTKRRGSRPAAPMPAPHATTVPKPPTGTADPPGRPSPPIECLDRAGLAHPAQRSQDTWGATARDGTLILVDGPYTSAAEAQQAVATMQDVVRAEAGGVYIASGPLRADVGHEVSAVARCLRNGSS